MFYIAKHFTTHAGVMLRPGDVFEGDSKDPKIMWQLSQKAIAPATPAFAAQEPENDDGQDDAQANQENFRQQMENLGYDASGNPLDGEDEALEECADLPELDPDDLGLVVTDAAETDEVAEEAPVKPAAKKNGRKKA